jgi:glycosyltransferase involved in cell wall biosynthesis
MIDSFPLVSIMLPVYNREDLIEETIKCAINQSYRNIELIISDNCSTDNTWKMLESYAKVDGRIRIFKTDRNLGPVLNWKNCIDRVQGSYTKILWSDDLISHDFIESALKEFDNDTSFVMTGIKIFDSESGKILSSTFFQKKNKYKTEVYLNDLLFYNKSGFPVSPCCALFRTDDIKASYVEQIPNNENLDFKKYGAGNDLLFFLITASKYKHVRCVNEFNTNFRSHPSSLTISNELNLYYEYAMSFFISNFYVEKRIDYRSKLYLIARKKSEYKMLIQSLNCEINFLNLVKNCISLIIYKAGVNFRFNK